MSGQVAQSAGFPLSRGHAQPAPVPPPRPAGPAKEAWQSLRSGRDELTLFLQFVVCRWRYFDTLVGRRQLGGVAVRQHLRVNAVRIHFSDTSATDVSQSRHHIVNRKQIRAVPRVDALICAVAKVSNGLSLCRLFVASCRRDAGIMRVFLKGDDSHMLSPRRLFSGGHTNRFTMGVKRRKRT